MKSSISNYWMSNTKCICLDSVFKNFITVFWNDNITKMYCRIFYNSRHLWKKWEQSYTSLEEALIFLIIRKQLTASVWMGWTENSIAATKLDSSGRNMEHILKKILYCNIYYFKRNFIVNFVYLVYLDKPLKLVWFLRSFFFAWIWKKHIHNILLTKWINQ